jgi:retron-type reverse transcriptase
MGLSNIWSRDNLLLAWRRLTTGKNIAYKRYFRNLYYAYEIALDANLKDMQERLRGGSFKPQQPTRVYLPKPSGLQRPLTLLSIEDQIVLQSIANVFAEKISPRRRKLENKYVFSNIVQHSRNSIFFLQDWRLSYSMFQTKIEEYFKADFRWIAHFDLAAYYDTICHDMLLRTAFPRTIDGYRAQLLEFLKKWSSEQVASCHGHGIPQGPIASDFLAECFLLPVDEHLQKQRFRFVRYVDDIRLFGKSENAIREGAIRMEVLLRERGLIPQGKKHAIMYAKTLDDAMGILPSIEPWDDDAQRGEDSLSSTEATEKFRGALSGRPLKIKDKTRARFVLFRAAPSKRLLDYVLRLMPRHPEHTDAFAHYLTKHRHSSRIVEQCANLAKGSPYEYVRGEMWHILAQMTQPHEMRQHLDSAVTVAKDKRACLMLKWAALHFLCVAERQRLGKYGKFLMYQKNALLLALLAPIFPDARYARGDVADKILRNSAFEPGIALAEQLVRLRLNHTDFGIQSRTLPTQVRNTFRALGLISSTSLGVDPMGEILSFRYKVQQWDDWRNLLAREYSHALGEKREKEGSGLHIYMFNKSLLLFFRNSPAESLGRETGSGLRIYKIPVNIRVIRHAPPGEIFRLLPFAPFASIRGSKSYLCALCASAVKDQRGVASTLLTESAIAHRPKMHSSES